MKIAKMYNNRRMKMSAEKMVTRRSMWSNASVKSTSLHTPPAQFLHLPLRCGSLPIVHFSHPLACAPQSLYLVPLNVKVSSVYVCAYSSVPLLSALPRATIACESLPIVPLQLLLLNHINKCHVHANCLLLWFYGRIARKCVRTAAALTWLWGLCSAYITLNTLHCM